MRFNRRNVITAALTAFAALPLPSAFVCGATIIPQRDAARERIDAWIIEMCSDIETIRQTGQRCLDSGAVPNDPDLLFERLLAHGHLHNRPELQSHLRRARHDDFAAGSVVLVDGWVLAQSEVLYAAYASLLIESRDD